MIPRAGPGGETDDDDERYATPGMAIKNGAVDAKEVEQRIDAFNCVQRGVRC